MGLLYVFAISIQLTLVTYVHGYGTANYYDQPCNIPPEGFSTSSTLKISPFFVSMQDVIAHRPVPMATGNHNEAVVAQLNGGMRSNKHPTMPSNFQSYQLSDYSSYAASPKFYWLLNRPTVGSDAINIDRPPSFWQNFFQLLYPSSSAPSIRPVFVRTTRTAVITITKQSFRVNSHVTPCIPLSLFVSTNPITCAVSPRRSLLFNAGIVDPQEDFSQFIDPSPVQSSSQVQTTVEPSGNSPAISDRQMESSFGFFAEHDDENDSFNLNHSTVLPPHRAPKRFVDATATRYTTNTVVYLTNVDVTSTINLATGSNVLMCIPPGVVVCN